MPSENRKIDHGSMWIMLFFAAVAFLACGCDGSDNGGEDGDADAAADLDAAADADGIDDDAGDADGTDDPDVDVDTIEDIIEDGDGGGDVPDASSWIVTWRSALDDYPTAVDVDADGNVYMTAYSVNRDADNANNITICKFSSTGELLWAKSWDGGGTRLTIERAMDIAVTADGHAYVAGFTNETGAGSNDALILAYGPDGELRWAKTWGGESADSLDGVALDPSGRIHAVGLSNSVGMYRNLIILVYDQDGTLLSESAWLAIDRSEGRAVAFDDDGNRYVLGLTGGMSLFNQGMLLKFDAGGALTSEIYWTYFQGDAVPKDLAVAAGGDVAVLDYWEDIGTGTQSYLIVSKHAPNLGQAWRVFWNSEEGASVFPYSIAFGDDGTVYAMAGAPRHVLIGFDGSDGTVLDAKTWTTPAGSMSGEDMLFLPDGQVLMAGQGYYATEDSWESNTHIAGDVITTHHTGPAVENPVSGTESSPAGLEEDLTTVLQLNSGEYDPILVKTGVSFE